MPHFSPQPEAPFITRRTGLLAALGAALTGCSALDVVDALVPADTYRSRNAMPYGPGARQRLDVYQPLNRPTASGPPIVVFFYGGNWNSGNREAYRFVGEALASAGAVVVIPDYRLYPEVRYPDFLRDCAAAVAWVFAHAGELGGDPSQVMVMGHSAGAYNAAMLALDPRWLGGERTRLAGLIGIAGPYDFLPIKNPVAQQVFNWPVTPLDSQVFQHLTSAAPRTLLIAPRQDLVVDPERNTKGLGRRLRNVGVDATAQVFDGLNHASVIGALARPLRFLAPVREQVIAFLGLASSAGK